MTVLLPPEDDPLLRMMARAEAMVPASAVAEAVAAERERIRRGAETLKFALPQERGIEVVLWEELSDLIREDVT